MGGSGLLFVDFDLHMKMQINIVVPTQNKTKNGAEKLGRKVKAPTWGRFTPRCGSAACSWASWRISTWILVLQLEVVDRDLATVDHSFSISDCRFGEEKGWYFGNTESPFGNMSPSTFCAPLNLR